MADSRKAFAFAAYQAIRAGEFDPWLPMFHAAIVGRRLPAPPVSPSLDVTESDGPGDGVSRAARPGEGDGASSENVGE